MASPSPQLVYRFGPFEFDNRAPELRKGETRLRVPERPLRILSMLIERRGELVPREEIQQSLWPNNTIVEFDHGINTAVRQLRSALGDSAETPKYIETMPRRGYRFLAEVTVVPAMPARVPSAPEADGIQAGVRFGPYELIAAIGHGGMGEVWKAHDSRLGRDVAVKISHERFSDRFEREARAIAALNHPNICTLFDVGPDYLVMELIEGPTLADRIKEGPIPLEEALGIARQIADALEAAHTKGIVHRDLKPANIKMRMDGSIKVLDFGLAKDIALAGLTPDSPTALSVSGTIMGTAGYMSPEQARGVATDKRADIWAFGVVLYEMVTGQKLFERSTLSDTLAAVIKEEPDLNLAPTRIRRLLGKCLQKDAKKRVRDLSSLEFLIEEPAPPLKRRELVVWVRAGAAVAVLALVLAAWALHSPQRPSHQVFIPMEVTREDPEDVVWSPDGQAFAYVAGADGDRRVLIRYINSPSATPLTRGAEKWITIGWSPDSKRIIALSKNPQGNKPELGMFAVPVFGGEPQLMAPYDGADPVDSAPAISADGRLMAMLRSEGGHVSVYTASPVGSHWKRYSPAPFESSTGVLAPVLCFSPDDHSLVLIWGTTSGIEGWRLPWPPGRGSPTKIFKGLPSYRTVPQFSWLPDSRTAVLALRNEQMEQNLWIVGVKSGKRRQLTNGTTLDWNPAVSPDGTKILYTRGGADYRIVSASLVDATVERIVSSERQVIMPAWAAHQEKFVYVSDQGGPAAIWMRSEGSDRPIVTTAAFPPGTTDTFMNPTLSPGADRVIYVRGEPGNGFRLWISSVSGGPPVRLTNAAEGYELGGSWSPDGSQFTYFCVSPKNEYSLNTVATTGEAAPKVLREKVGISLPTWSPDGRWIKFLAGEGGGGWSLISPEGGSVRANGEPDTIEMTFSADSNLLYGIRSVKDHRYLYSLDIATKAEKTIGDIGKEFTPNSESQPEIRLTLSPDGKHILFPAYRWNDSIWMLQGFEGPTWTESLREMLPW